MGPSVFELAEREDRDEDRDDTNTKKYIKLIIDRHRLPY